MIFRLMAIDNRADYLKRFFDNALKEVGPKY